jgi:hypothetical protein
MILALYAASSPEKRLSPWALRHTRDLQPIDQQANQRPLLTVSSTTGHPTVSKRDCQSWARSEQRAFVGAMYTACRWQR